MNRTISFIFTFLLCSLQMFSQNNNLQEKVASTASDPVFSQSLIGICVRTCDGQTIAESDSRKMLVPASNMKLISTGAALHHLGPDYRFRTEIGYDGEISNGILHGDLYIIGGGDPLLGSKDSIAVKIETVFKEWEKLIRQAGIRRIEGHIIGDGRWLDGMAEEPTWLWNDIGTYYGTGLSGLCFYENMQSFSVSPGPETGAPMKISPSYPECPWMEFRYNCTTGEKGTGDMLYMYTCDLAPIAEIRGTFGVDRGKKRVDCSNKFPEYTCAEYFKAYLDKKGIRCSEGASDFRLKGHRKPESNIRILGGTYSPSLERIVFETNHASNNLFADMLMRTLGKELRGSSCADSSRLAMNDVLKSIGTDLSYGQKICDGSGLSRQNYISPDFICRFLTSMMGSPHFEEYLNSLPVPGGNGSLNYNMKNVPLNIRSRIRVKSGSMNGVRCYSGYILPEGYTFTPGQDIPESIKNQIIILSIMTNNCTSPNWKVRPMLDRLMEDIAGYRPTCQ